MAQVTGAHNERVALARELLSQKGRKTQGLFAFEGPTLLEEAIRSSVEIREVFCTESVHRHNERVSDLDTNGTAVHIVDDRTMKKISDVETPTGLVCVAPLKYAALESILGAPLSLVLADLNDPGNAGTLLRSADAFGAQGVVFGNLGVDPYHPKVVRGAMGAIFRLKLAIADPATFSAAAKTASTRVLGLDAAGTPLETAQKAAATALVVGHERRGLGPWDEAIEARVALHMRGEAESLNAAVAGSIALYSLQKP